MLNFSVIWGSLASHAIHDEPVAVNSAFFICHNKSLWLKHQASNCYGRDEIMLLTFTTIRCAALL